MPAILHLLDSTTPPDSLNLLAQILSHTHYDHHLAAIGHRSTTDLAIAAGITQPITFLPSLGWADPTTHRALAKLLARIPPTHLHAWGLPATLAASLSRPTNQPIRLCTLTEPPAPRHLRPLRLLQKIKPRTEHCRFQFSVTNTAIAHSLTTTAQIDPSRITRISPAIPQSASPPPPDLREQLALEPHNFPILLLAGEGGSAGTRHDYGLWSAAILHMLFPNVRCIIREDPRGRPDPGLDRMAENLHDDHIPIIAPAQYSWHDLLSLADLFLITADRPIALGDTLAAITTGVPVLAPPLQPHDSLADLLIDHETALIARDPKPRSFAARAEEFLADPTGGGGEGLKAPLIARARARLTQLHPPEKSLQSLLALYHPVPNNDPLASVTPIPTLAPA